MKHHLPNLGDDAATYEAAILDILQKHPQSSSGALIKIHEAGTAGGAYTAREAWPPGSKSPADIAKLVAHKIVGEYKFHVGCVFKAVTLDF